MNIGQALDTLATVEKVIWSHFDLEPQALNIMDKRNCRWSQGIQDIGWWETDLDWSAAITEAAGNLEDVEPTGSGDVYRTSIWSTKSYTLFVLDDGCGNRDAYIFLNSNKV